jgi:hypothetical protein
MDIINSLYQFIFRASIFDCMWTDELIKLFAEEIVFNPTKT